MILTNADVTIKYGGEEYVLPLDNEILDSSGLSAMPLAKVTLEDATAQDFDYVFVNPDMSGGRIIKENVADYFFDAMHELYEIGVEFDWSVGGLNEFLIGFTALDDLAQAKIIALLANHDKDYSFPRQPNAVTWARDVAYSEIDASEIWDIFEDSADAVIMKPNAKNAYVISGTGY